MFKSGGWYLVLAVIVILVVLIFAFGGMRNKVLDRKVDEAAHELDTVSIVVNPKPLDVRAEILELVLKAFDTQGVILVDSEDEVRFLGADGKFIDVCSFPVFSEPDVADKNREETCVRNLTLTQALVYATGGNGQLCRTKCARGGRRNWCNYSNDKWCKKPYPPCDEECPKPLN